MIQRVDATLMAVATPLAARVLLPVVPAPANTSVSDVIAIVTVPAEVSFTNVMAVPIGYETLAFESIVNVLAVVSDDGWYMCFPESPRTVVYAALCEFCGIFRYPMLELVFPPHCCQVAAVELVAVST